MKRFLGLAAAVAVGFPGLAAAQDLGDRIARAGDGPVRFEFATRPGVCGDGAGMIGTRPEGEDGVHSTRISTQRWGSGGYRASSGDWATRCRPGPARVTLDMAGGRVRGLDLEVGDGVEGSGGTDLGAVTPA